MVAALDRRNHKSTDKYVNVLIGSVKKEICTGFQFLFNVENIFKIKGAVVQHYGIAVQKTVNNLGKPITNITQLMINLLIIQKATLLITN